MPSDFPRVRRRGAFLDDACGGNAELRQRVDRLLKEARRCSEFSRVAGSSSTRTTGQSLTEQPGTQIGPYKLVQQIGEGGLERCIWQSRSGQLSVAWR